ncbi:hypothetical protein KIN20_005839 [Parelaphostrongylus tenuis]|uniref:Uncharacterized protein n=1 Tax=Parelaphostrongylus tenuis TaxID=148309 RepID=A0AAD5MJB2_PARTN|nr:hypothetical protein KIN20_005839 [Parelaphostrongylus tenuis]
MDGSTRHWWLQLVAAEPPSNRRLSNEGEAPATLLGTIWSLHSKRNVVCHSQDWALRKSQHFCQEFIARPLNGVELLSKVLNVLQGIINSSQISSSKISNLLSRSNTNNVNRKRKAAVAEADCIECLKILLEKSENAWRRFLDLTTGMDAVLFAVNSPQLDSKCYAVEVGILMCFDFQEISN